MVSRWTKIRAALSQLLCVVLFNGHEDEMLSSYAYRTNTVWLINLLDYWFGKDHCKQSYEWDKKRDADY